MRAVDTNVLVRYVVNDDPKQVAVVEKFWVECETNQEAVFIPVLVLCELVWVLGRLYAQTKPQLIEVLEKLLAVGFFRFEQESAVRQSLEHYRRGKATFPDYVIGEISRQAGCRDTVTFDRDLRGAPGSPSFRSRIACVRRFRGSRLPWRFRTRLTGAVQYLPKESSDSRAIREYPGRTRRRHHRWLEPN